MKRGSVYIRRGQLFVYPSSKTTDGVWIMEDPCLKLDESASQTAKGSAVRDALSRSRVSVPHPTSWDGLMDELLKAAGVKSWSTFVKSAKHVGVEAEGEQVAFIPTKNLGARDGFVDLEAAIIRTSRFASDEELGSALESAIHGCE